jgi:hypothetical protein
MHDDFDPAPPARLKTDPLRSSTHITHVGQSNRARVTGAPPNRHPTFAKSLWTSGDLIYSVRSPESCLGPPSSRADRTLRFNSHFESGNLSRAYRIGPDGYHLILEYDSNGSGSCQWFYFEASNVRKDAQYTFVISGFHKNRGVFTAGAKVFWYSERQAARTDISWARGGTDYQYGWTLRSDRDRRCSLQFQMKFPHDDDVVYLAYGVPYTYSDLVVYCRVWRQMAPECVTVQTLCESFGGRRCPLLIVTNGSPEQKDVVFLTARCHPGESNGSVVLHGFIDFLLSGSNAARYLLDNYVFRIVPMICIDGVIEGNYRVCVCGSDLNRMWATPDPVKHPIVWATKRLMREKPPRVYIDFHGHSRMNGTFAYGCPSPDAEFRGRERLFPKLIAILTDLFAFGSCTFSMPERRLTTSRCVANRELGVRESFTIESSFGAVPNGRLVSVLYDEHLWKEMGAKICEGLSHLLTVGSSRLRSLAERELKLVQRPLPDSSKKSDGGVPEMRGLRKPSLSRPVGGKTILTSASVALIQRSSKPLCSPTTTSSSAGCNRARLRQSASRYHSTGCTGASSSSSSSTRTGSACSASCRSSSSTGSSS